MDNPRINIRYARALFELARESNVLNETSTDMALIADTCINNRELQLLLKSPVINAKKKISIIRQIFGQVLGKVSMAFVEIIIRKRREEHLMNIALKFGDIYRDHNNIKKAVVTTISPLTAEMREELIGVLSKQTGSAIELSEQTDPSIIGGMIVKLDGLQFDDSIRKKLQNLKNEFNVNTFIREF